jgi:hypothetical protein
LNDRLARVERLLTVSGAFAKMDALDAEQQAAHEANIAQLAETNQNVAEAESAAIAPGV